MTTSADEVLKKFLANCERAILLIPEKLRREFRNKIILREEAEAYANLAFRG